MSIPTENVGSLPRPAKLQAALADYDAGKIDFDQLKLEQDGHAAIRFNAWRQPGRRLFLTGNNEHRASRLIL